MKTLASIQYLRAVAALAVVSYHAGQWILSPYSVGAAGVDVFFVISGFVMWTTTWGRQVSPAAFLWRRVTRVAPPYWLATLALAAAATAMPGVFPHVTPQLRHVILSMLFTPHLNPEGAVFPLLAVGWTLTYEAAFYLIFAAALALPPRLRMAALAAGLSALGVAGLFYFPLYTYLANPMVLQFLAGAVLGRLWLQRHLPGRAAGAGLVGLALLLFAAAELIHVVPDSLSRPVTWGVPAMMLVMGGLCLDAPQAGPARVMGWLGRLGDASYSLYLVHTPVMALFNRAIGPTHPALFFVLAMALSIAAGLACHRWVERPLLAAVRRAPSPPG